MKQKHFTFDLDYFPMSSSNIFQSIKIQQKNVNKNVNKNGLKRFSIKNELNFQQIPEVMYFQKSIKKSKNIQEKQYLNSLSNKTKKSKNQSDEQMVWSFEKKSNLQKSISDHNQFKLFYQNNQTEEDNPLNQQVIKKFEPLKQISVNNLIQVQKKLKLKSKNYNIFGNQRKSSQELQSLQQCQSQFDQSETEAKTISDTNVINKNLVTEKDQRKQKVNLKKQLDKNTKASYNQKGSSKKKFKNNNNDLSKNNPQSISNKSRRKRQNQTFEKDKQQNSLRNSVLALQQNKKTQKKYISLNKKSYYVIGSKNNKHRSLNKQKKIKNKSQREDANIFLSNGDIVQNLSNVPVMLKNQSLTNSIHSKLKIQSCKSTKQSVMDRKQIILDERLSLPSKKSQSRSQIKLFELLKKTEQVLNQYKGECCKLKRQKQQYEGKYNQAIKKLNRIKQELESQNNEIKLSI